MISTCIQIFQVELYGELATCCKHIGLDDTVPGEYKPGMTLAEERLIIGNKGFYLTYSGC